MAKRKKRPNLPPRDWQGWLERQRLLEERIAAGWAKLGIEPQTIEQRLERARRRGH